VTKRPRGPAVFLLRHVAMERRAGYRALIVEDDRICRLLAKPFDIQLVLFARECTRTDAA